MRRSVVLFFIILTTPLAAFAQEDDLGLDSTMGIIDTSVLSHYQFIHYAANQFEFFTDESPAFGKFYEKFDKLINDKEGQVVIYHYGGSHIQADIYSNRMRTYLNTYWPGLTGARGLVFPYSLAGTNNPGNYKVDGFGEWESHRCVVRKDTTRLGIEGISVSTTDSLSGFKIYYRENELMPYKHDRIKVYHNINCKNYKVTFGNPDLVDHVVEDTITGYTQFFLKQETDTADIRIQRLGSDSIPFYTYGVELMNNRPGVIYNSIGVNGAAFPNYLRCEDMEVQMAQMKPDLVIFSVGTNDANVPAEDFKPEVYKANCKAMIERVLSVNPDAAILLTVPNDAYYYRRYPNKNVAKEETVIKELAQEYQMAVWDFYDIMGGFGSSQIWYRNDLMHKDRIHFTWNGYLLKGDIFFEAFLKYLDEFELRRLTKQAEQN